MQRAMDLQLVSAYLARLMYLGETSFHQLLHLDTRMSGRLDVYCRVSSAVGGIFALLVFQVR